MRSVPQRTQKSRETRHDDTVARNHHTDGNGARRVCIGSARRTGVISTVAGTGQPGFSGDGGPATSAALRMPHSLAFDPQGRLLICDIGNHRIRRVDLRTGLIETYAGTGERGPTPDGAPLGGTPLNGPRTLTVDRDGNVYLALREGNAIYRIDAMTARLRHVAGTGETGYSGDGG